MLRLPGLFPPLLRLPQPLPGLTVVARPQLLLWPVVLVHILALPLPDDIERLGVALRQPDDLQQPCTGVSPRVQALCVPPRTFQQYLMGDAAPCPSPDELH
ncbi:MAG: hypothetical protein Q8R70_10760 [Methanoregula sp.]|nr:hypothetical protein [Methanoregula sp.]